MYNGCLCKLQATTHFLYSVCANSRPPLYLLACANSRLVSTYIYLSYLFPSPTTIIRQLPALSPQHQVNTRPDPLHACTMNSGLSCSFFSSSVCVCASRMAAAAEIVSPYLCLFTQVTSQSHLAYTQTQSSAEQCDFCLHN